MRLEKLTLENFRNYQKTEAHISSDVVLIVGENATGKTNFLESIYFLSNLKSFRAPDGFLIKHNHDHFSVKASISANQQLEELEVVVQQSVGLKRAFKMNGQKIKRISWSAFKTVLFVPNDLNMFILGKEARRKYLNEVLVQNDSLYAMDLSSLDHILKQRKALLQKIREGLADPLELEFWDVELAAVSVRISRSRQKFLDYLNDKLTATFEELTGFSSQLQVVYKGIDPQTTEQLFVEELQRHRQAEISAGSNLIGPHRDDFVILKDDYENIYNSSRGELREQVIAIKILQAEYITVGADKPIILLDDVFSELDSSRRSRLLQNFSQTQVFITATEPVVEAENIQIIETGKL